MGPAPPNRAVESLTGFEVARDEQKPADARAATVTGDPLALARALRKIQRRSEVGRGILSLRYVQTDEGDRLRRLLATHPSTEERVRRLLERVDERGRSAAASFGP